MRKKKMLKQRMAGLGMILIGILCPVMTGDGTISVFVFPAGFGLLLAQKPVEYY